MRITFGRSGAWTTRAGGPQPVLSKLTATNVRTAKRVAWRIRRRGLGRFVVACAIGERLYCGRSFRLQSTMNLTTSPYSSECVEREFKEVRPPGEVVPPAARSASEETISDKATALAMASSSMQSVDT